MAAMAAIGKAATIPLSRFTFTASKDGRQYTDLIVGQNPFAATHTPTHVKILPFTLAARCSIRPLQISAAGRWDTLTFKTSGARRSLPP